MSAPLRIREGLTLEEFLRLPGIDEHPYLEYIDGRIEAKVAPQKKHGILERKFLDRLDEFAEPKGLGQAFPELRCTFAGRSIVPDVVFLRDEHIETDDRGEFADETTIPPDIHIEILSPDRHEARSRRKLEFSTAHGCPLGWLIHPYRRTIDVYRPGLPPERLAPEGVLDGDPVLPGLRLPVAEVFGWLIRRGPGRRPPGAPA